MKSLVTAIAVLCVGPFAFWEKLARAIAGHDVFFPALAEFFSLFPGKSGSYLRNAFYHFTLTRCPLNLRLLLGTMFTHSEVEVGERVYFGAHCIVGMAKIGEDTLFADHVYVLSGKNQHGTADPAIPIQQQPQQFTQITIGRNVWVGTNSVIMADIGDDCIIGAGSVVTRAIPAATVAVGNPARVIRPRFTDSKPAVTSH